MMKRRIGILTSGGDTPGMNTAIRAVVMAAENADIEVLGIKRGYAGLLEGCVEVLRPKDVEGIGDRGGTVLKTARCVEFKTGEGRKAAVGVLRSHEVSGLVVIGGDGSFTGARLLSEMGIPTIGIPGTIDNDLAYTDYTIGFDTAVNCVIGEMSRIRDTMNSHERICVIEVMGNRCGDITLYAGITGCAEHIILPELENNMDEMCDRITFARARGKMTSLVLVAEGAGRSGDVAKFLRDKTNIDAKAVVLGYTQRGGAPTKRDRLLASRMGVCAVGLLASGRGNRLVGIRNDEIIDEDIQNALAKKPTFNMKLYEEYKIICGTA